MPVVSYALPALIAIGQCVHAHRPTKNLFFGPLRWMAKGLSLKVLRQVQPTSGGYLEATPLTSFVVMALSSIRRRRREAEKQVIAEGVRFIVNSMRPDGSWPIDTNLATWVTTLAVNALFGAGDLGPLNNKTELLCWLCDQQYKKRHPYTGADPGGWAWTDLPGGVPDCDDTPGAMMAVYSIQNALEEESGIDAFPNTSPPCELGRVWITSLQNSDGGYPTFCRGWGTLPFDRSGCDLTGHAIRALRRIPAPNQLDPFSLDETAIRNGLMYLTRQQRPDGSWLPLWFGNQHAPDDINPVYGTSRVLAAYRDLWLNDSPECQRGVSYLLSVQNADGGWGGAKDCPSSVEETSLAVEVLLDLQPGEAVKKGVLWLVEAVESRRFREPTPIGFYFAKLWYYEKLYPLIFTVAALGRAFRHPEYRLTSSPEAGSA
jgi:squalene-hopene/tetraprenyl-beta-curcumene cyclase